MKFTCTQQNLTKGLTIVSQAVGTDTTLPVLSNVLLQTENGRLKLSATDLETGINIYVGGKVETDGSVTVPAKLLAEYVRSLPAEKITLSAKDNILNLQAGTYSAKLNGIDPEEFPLIPKIEKKEICTVEATDFLAAVNKTVFAAASDESRPELAGVYMAFADKKVTLAATDSYRLAETVVNDAKIAGEAKNTIVPAKTLTELLHILGDEVEGEVVISLSDNQMMFKYGDANLITRLVEGKFPDYQQIIPEKFMTESEFDRQELLQGVKVTGLFAEQGANDIRFEFNPSSGQTSLYAASSQVGKNTSKLKGSLKGETSQAVFNYRYLLDGLAAIKSDKIKFLTNGSTGPGVLRPINGQDYTYVVMPIKQ
ncbi:DNA polymerase III subunit beta [Patescibacteria group bacterium]